MMDVYETASERALSLGAIRALSEETATPVAEVQRRYERELARLKAGAQVKDYLTILASRLVRESLKGERH